MLKKFNKVKDINAQVLHNLGNPEWKHNWTIGRPGPYMEITELSNRTVWICQEPISYEEGPSLLLPERFMITGIGESAHDAAFFPRSPDATKEGPLETMQVGKYIFSKVAKPGKPESGFTDVLVLPVYKYHKVMFCAGRTIEVLRMEDGKDYVPNVYAMKGMFANAPKERVLPEGWAIRKITLANDLVLEIPNPARVCFFKFGTGFHGPVNLSL